MFAHELLVRFLTILRASGVRISVAEELDAMLVAEVVGYQDRGLLRDALGLTVAKSLEEKVIFETCFDDFFNREELKEKLASEREAGGKTGEENGLDSTLGQMLLDGDRSGLLLAIEMAANQVGISQIRLFTQINLYAQRILEQMDLGGVQAEIGSMRRLGSPQMSQQANQLEIALEDLREDVREYVRRQFEVFARGEPDRIRDGFLYQMRLGNINPRDKARLRIIIGQIARRLATRHARVLRKKRKGQLDVRRMIRNNIPNDGILFRTSFRFKKVNRPKIVAICDVSGSVASSAEFLLFFLWSLREVLSGVRAFAFSSDLIEVTEILDTLDPEEATKKIMNSIGFGATNYGNSLCTFRKNWMNIVDRKTTVIILGDGRGKRTEPRVDIVRELSERAKRLIWLNPEQRQVWGSGDSDMLRYIPYCHLAKVCNSVADLETVVSDLLEAERHG
jgi:uncharacterized protein with von Willebrand factor type A (vWA) domain